MVLDDTYDDINSANKVPVPSNAQLDAAKEAIKKGKKNNKEYGFVMGADGTVSNVVEGKTGSVNLGPGYEELEGGSESDAHYHPFDFQLIEKMASLSLNTLILSLQKKTEQSDQVEKLTPPATRLSVLFYNATNENLEQQSYSWQEFSKAVRRINGVK